MSQPYPYPPTPSAVTPEPPRRPRPVLRRVVLGAAFLLTFLIGVAVGGAGAPTAPDAPVPAPVTSQSAPPTATTEVPAPVVPAPPVTAPTPAPVAETAPVGPFPPAAAFTNGAWSVGTEDEVTPGVYRSPGPDTGAYPLCYVDTTVGDKIVSQEVSDDGPVRITLVSGQTVKSSGCQRFTKVG